MGKKTTTPLHVFKWKLECHIFKYGIHLHLTTKLRNLSFALQREIFSFKKKPVLRVFESLPKRDLVDFESHLVQSVTLFNEFFLYHFISLPNSLTLEQLYISPSHKVLTFKIYIIETS